MYSRRFLKTITAVVIPTIAVNITEVKIIPASTVVVIVLFCIIASGGGVTVTGGSDAEIGREVTLDNEGNVYVTGQTSSNFFPTTSYAYDVLISGDSDCFVFKLSTIASTQRFGLSIIETTFIAFPTLALFAMIYFVRQKRK
ncbi:MAG: SBBP repeat-containing protein [Candidatus Heimdallarchaeota archaeon]|nr:SBBP repeat-containing protein [Candidatus Heimdallarchaeota archaeon]MCK4290104.1 SBBP repeat-containing protein [Candidatus Heimdallarchaeota archaeon]